MQRYRIERVLNNNVVIVNSEESREEILVGKGIGFGHKSGDKIDFDQQAIEKRFTLALDENKNQFNQLFATVNEEVIGIAEEIIAIASKDLNCSMHEHIHVALADHIGFALTRLQGDLTIKNPFLEEIKLLYEKEWDVAHKAAILLEERFHVPIPDDEKGFLTLHIHSATHAKGLSETVRITDAINMAVQAIEKAMRTKLSLHQLNYARLVAHLRYAIQRILQNQTIENPLADAVIEKLPESYAIAVEAAKEISQRIRKRVPDGETSYLAMHIERLRGAIYGETSE